MEIQGQEKLGRRHETLEVESAVVSHGRVSGAGQAGTAVCPCVPQP